MTVFELVRLIADNSFMVVCAAIILWVFLRNEKRRTIKEDLAEKQKIKDEETAKEERKRENEIRDKQYNVVLDKLFAKFDACANKNPEIHTPQEDEFQEKVNDSIDEVLRKLRSSIDADRCMLVRYHNGSYDLAGNPANKMSATNEAIRDGLAPFAPNFQNQFRSVFAPWCTLIREQGYIGVSDTSIDVIPELVPLREYSKIRGMHNAFGQAVYDKNQYVIGYITAENVDLKTHSMEQVESCMKDKALKISALLVLKQNLKEG